MNKFCLDLEVVTNRPKTETAATLAAISATPTVQQLVLTAAKCAAAHQVQSRHNLRIMAVLSVVFSTLKCRN
jgi:hypothetical protein